MSEQLRHKMIDFEVAPPSAAWEAIAARLADNQQYAAVATKMSNFDAAPPPQVWNNILTSLNQTKKEKTPVVNISRIMYRIGAAVVVIGLFTGGWMMLNRNTAKIDLVKNTTVSNPVQPLIKENNAEGTNKSGDNQTQTTEPAFIQNKKTVQHHTKTNPAFNADNDHIIRYAIVNNLPVYRKAPITISSSPFLDKDGNLIRDIDILTTSNNYLTVTGPNGQTTRISSKFANVIRYLNGSTDDTAEYLDKVIIESDTWKKRFQEWRSKISQSSFIPSSANFLDIIEFKELIQEKR